jgi:endonuclease-3
MWTGTTSEKRRRMGKIIRKLKEWYPSQSQHPIQDSFSLLIATILSQNTSNKNSSQAFQNLQANIDIKPWILAKLDPEAIKPLIKIAGLYEIRSRRIVEVAKMVLERFDGDLDTVLQRPIDEARNELLSLEGVGPKTADILLAFRGNRSVMPIDTNIFRVAERIGLVKGRNYEKTRFALEELIPKQEMSMLHLILIRHGREICKPRKPLCLKCPIKNLCNYPEK